MDSDTANASRSPHRYSPFWALCVVFLPLIYLQTSYLIGDFKQHQEIAEQRDQIQAARDQLKVPLVRAQSLRQVTEAVGRELLAVSTNSPGAARIVADFKIQINDSPESAQ